MDGVNYYQLFSLTSDATQDELKNSYRRLSLAHHPDRGGSTEQMAALNEAYRVLSNPLLRREYDQKRARAQIARPDEYHYTRSQSAAAHAHAAAQAPPQSHFWSWFIVLALLGAALIAYDVMATWVLPRYVRESSLGASSENLTPSGDLTDEAASALSEFQGSTQLNQAAQQPAQPPAQTPRTNAPEQRSTPYDRSSWRERARANE